VIPQLASVMSTVVLSVPAKYALTLKNPLYKAGDPFPVTEYYEIAALAGVNTPAALLYTT